MIEGQELPGRIWHQLGPTGDENYENPAVKARGGVLAPQSLGPRNAQLSGDSQELIRGRGRSCVTY